MITRVIFLSAALALNLSPSACAESLRTQQIPDDAHIKAAADYSFASAGQTFLVLQKGKIIAEQYGNGGSVEKRELLASGSKSFVGLAAVAAVQDGILNLDDPVCEAITEWNKDPLKSKITYRQLLTLTSGLTPGERGYAVRGPAWPDIAAKPMVSNPGERFDYGAYHLNTFAYALELKLKGETFEQYLKRKILDPLGVTVEWRYRCEDGHPQVGGGGFMTARDWAIYGEMIENRGRYGERNIVDPAILAQCFQGTPENPTYGLTWWLKKPVNVRLAASIPTLGRDWSAVANSRWLPNDLIAARGAGNQRLFIIPSLNLVVVRQASLAGARPRAGSEGSQRFSDYQFLLKLLGN